MRFISFEGVEGSGKTSLSVWLVEQLQNRGDEAHWTREPGGGDPDIRQRLLDIAHLDDETELKLFLEDRRLHAQNKIGPWLKSGAWVVCDRFADSTVAYQGYARGKSPQLLRKLNAEATGGLMPTVTFLIDLPAGIGLRRQSERNRFELESAAFHERVRTGYLTEAALAPDRFVLLNGCLDPGTLQKQVWAVIAQKWSLR